MASSSMPFSMACAVRATSRYPIRTHERMACISGFRPQNSTFRLRSTYPRTYMSNSCSSSAALLSRSPCCQFIPDILHLPCGRSFSRSFSSTPSLPAKTIQQLRARASTGPFSWKAAALFIITGAAMIVYFQYEKARLERKRIVEMSKGVGKPKVGGPFVLKDLQGREFTQENMKGKYSLVSGYFHLDIPSNLIIYLRLSIGTMWSICVLFLLFG